MVSVCFLHAHYAKQMQHRLVEGMQVQGLKAQGWRRWRTEKEEAMHIVQVEILEGRSVEQKRQMVAEVTEVISRTLECPQEAVTIMIRELPQEHLARAGKLAAD